MSLSQIFFALAGLSAIGVVASLLLGVGVMTKGGETDKKYSNKFMQARIITQAATILFFILGMVVR